MEQESEEMTDEDRLLRCPHCNEPPYIWYDVRPYRLPRIANVPMWCIECVDCHIRVCAEDKEKAIIMWNKVVE